MRNAPAHAGIGERRVIHVFIATAFARSTPKSRLLCASSPNNCS
jgi:hypothetical protein